FRVLELRLWKLPQSGETKRFIVLVNSRRPRLFEQLGGFLLLFRGKWPSFFLCDLESAERLLPFPALQQCCPAAAMRQPAPPLTILRVLKIFVDARECVQPLFVIPAAEILNCSQNPPVHKGIFLACGWLRRLLSAKRCSRRAKNKQKSR